MRLPSAIQELLSRAYYRRYESAPRLFSHYRRFRANETKSSDELHAIQAAYLGRLVQHAYAHTRYYRELFDSCGLDPRDIAGVEDLRHLPKLTKTIIEERFADLTADNLSGRDYHASYTGGTRGKKTRFLRDNDCRAKRIALQWRSDAWAGWRLHDKVAYIWPAFQDISHHDEFKQYLVEEFLRRTKIYYAGALSEVNAMGIYESLVRYRPKFVRCFPTAAAYLARCLHQAGRTVPGVTAVVSTGEPITPNQQDEIAAVFEAPVFNLYASRENGTIAAECECHDALHVAVDSVVVQVEADATYSDDMNEGNLLVTDLHNYAMPMIRYEIGDFGRLLDGGCACPLRFPLMRNVVGRLADGFWDAEQNYVSPLALGNLMEASADRRIKAQLIQEPNYDIVVRVSRRSKPDRETIECICNRIRAVFGDRLAVRWELVEDILPEASGKYRFSICRVGELSGGGVSPDRECF